MPDTASEAHKRSFILAGEAVTWQGESEAETEKSGGEDEKSREETKTDLYNLELGMGVWGQRLAGVARGGHRG